jgi:cytochrome c oxidase assembly protein subunit 15
MQLPQRLRLSPRAYARVTLAAVLLLVAIIATGGAVRVTGSGLGCPEWPTCEEGRLAPALFEESSYHATVEFVNRAITGLVSLIVIAAVAGAFVRQPRRRDLTWLAAGLVGGVVGQIVLGGITVMTDLHPVSVQSHFLLSLLIVLNAVVLHGRASADPTAPSSGVSKVVERLSLVTLLVLLAAILAGTVLTGTGPHGGDPDAQRFALHPPSVARVHGVLVEMFTALLLVTLVIAWRQRAPVRVLRRGSAVIAVAIGQTVVGYVQYFTGVPALLVGIHILGAAVLWTVAVRFHLAVSPVRPEHVGSRRVLGDPVVAQ